MRIHALKVGSMSIKTSYYAGKGKVRALRLSSVLLDPQFMEVPVYAWAIEHPEGVIVIDTGLTARMTAPSYFPWLQRPYWLTQYRFNITPDEEIGPQLIARGISPGDVRWVVLTHAHFDHTQALYHFPNSEIVFYHKEYQDVQTFRSAHFDFPAKWPKGLKIRQIDYVNEPVGPFAESYPLTQAGDVRLLPTPGHTDTHQSVILQENGLTYFFAGDTSFDLKSLLDGTIDAPAMNSDLTLETRQRIIELGRTTPLVYLPTHDAETGTRLAHRTPLFAATTQNAYEHAVLP